MCNIEFAITHAYVDVGSSCYSDWLELCRNKIFGWFLFYCCICVERDSEPVPGNCESKFKQ